MKKEGAREYRISVERGEIWGYTPRGSTAFRITQKDEDTFEAEDYLGGWISPPLDIVGAWHLAQQVGITKEEFKEAFGRLPGEYEVSLEEFVSWFFTHGQVPVLLYSPIDYTVSHAVIEHYEDLYSKEFKEYLKNYDLPIDEHSIVMAVHETFSLVGVYEILSKASDREIFDEILFPVFGDYIEFDKKKNLVRIKDIDDFLDFAEDSSDMLYSCLLDFFDEKIAELVTMDKLVEEYKRELEKAKRRKVIDVD